MNESEQTSIPVAVGHVYGTSKGMRHVVTGRDEEESRHLGYDMWHLDGGRACTNVAYYVNAEGWRLIGFVLPDGRQMCLGETWESRNDAGRVYLNHLVRLVDVNAPYSRDEVGFKNERGGLITRSDVAARADRWKKVEVEPAAAPTASDIPVAVGHVYRAPSGTQHTVIAAGSTVELWRLVGFALPDGRQVLVGEAWEYRNSAGGVRQHCLTSVHMRGRDGAVAFRNEHEALIMQSDLAREPERWTKVAPKAPVETDKIVVVVVGHVYETSRGTRHVVSSANKTTGFCQLDGKAHSARVARYVERGEWTLIGFVLPDGRQMLAGEAWEFHGNAGTGVVSFQLLSARTRDGEVYFRVEGGGLVVQRDVVAHAERWRKVEPDVASAAYQRIFEKPVCSCPDAPCACCHGSGDCPHVERVGNATGPVSAPAGTSDGQEIKLISKPATRAEVDHLLAEDARRHPDYAYARKAAVVTLHETSDGRPREPTLVDVRAILAACHAFEAARGHRVQPKEEAWHAAVGVYVDSPVEMSVTPKNALRTYERARLS